MSEFIIALSNVAPLYNLVFVLIAFFLFLKLFMLTGKEHVRLFPWKLIFVALFIYILEEVITILRMNEIVNIPRHINGFFELSMIIIFIYALLDLRQHIKEKHKLL